MFPRPVLKTQTPTSSPPLRFPQKLWKIANECHSGAVSWSPHGKSILLRYSLFKEEFMSTKSDFFKTDNISSFVRQLNLYGFRKVYDHTHKQAYKGNPDLHEFSNTYFQRDRSDLLDKVTRKSGVLKDRNDFLSDGQRSVELTSDSHSENKFDEEINTVEDSYFNQPLVIDDGAQTSQHHISEESDVKDKETPQPADVPHSEQFPQQAEAISFGAEVAAEPLKKKRGRKPGSKREPSKVKPFRFPKLNFKQRKEFSPTLKRPDLFPNLIFYDDEDDSVFLRNTSPDVMLSSTIPFQESPELQELKETYHQLYECRMRNIRYPAKPLSILGHGKAPPDDKQKVLRL